MADQKQAQKLDEDLKALWDLVHEGSITHFEAVRIWMQETGHSLATASNLGVIQYLRSATHKE